MIGRFRRRELRRELHDPGTRLARTQSRPLDRLLHDFFADCVCRETASFTVRQRRREFSIRPGGGEESGCFSLECLPAVRSCWAAPRPVITASSLTLTRAARTPGPWPPSTAVRLQNPVALPP
ncbi:hypothetical protein ACCO45_011762 [Purpureocillium lilacinum]|uniref:Uncharacterized protein n=1 Tax=Purpureocillium lilacinum TaxID=33203 RepID=A0ACC4DBR8_PURLI